MTPADDLATDFLRGLRHASLSVRIKAARALAKFSKPVPQAFRLLIAAVNDPEQASGKLRFKRWDPTAKTSCPP